MPVQALRGALANARDRGTHIYCVTVPCGHALRAALHADPLLVFAALLLFAAAAIVALAASVAVVAGAAATRRAKRCSAVAAVALVAFSARWWQQDARAGVNHCACASEARHSGTHNDDVVHVRFARLQVVVGVRRQQPLL